MIDTGEGSWKENNAQDPSPLSLPPVPPIPSRADSAPVFYACRPQSRQRPRVTFAWRALTRSCGQKSLVPRSVYGCGRVLVPYFLQPRPYHTHHPLPTAHPTVPYISSSQAFIISSCGQRRSYPDS